MSSICRQSRGSGRRRSSTGPTPREFVTDIYHPRRLNPVLILQKMDSADHEWRRPRDRIRLVLNVPNDQLQHRIDAAVAAGGQVVSTTAD